MDKDSLPNRDILRSIVVEVGVSTEKETRRVTDNSPQLNLVRRPGEGSRPLFDRNEIINGRRINGDLRQERRFADRPQNENLDFENDNNNYRSSHHAGISGRMSSGSFSDLLFLCRGGRCPMCHSNLDYLIECGEDCAEESQRRVYRTLSDDRLTREHSRGHHYYSPVGIESYYLCEDPHCYGVWNNSVPDSLYNYDYFSN